jgi:RimJ/RimL family protein N-acetyltransferase
MQRDSSTGLSQVWSRVALLQGADAHAIMRRMDKIIDTGRLRRLVAMVHPDNVASANVLTKLGFTVEKQIRYSGLNDVDVNLFARSL